jgi:hypothetical protein
MHYDYLYPRYCEALILSCRYFLTDPGRSEFWDRVAQRLRLLMRAA